ncbi:MAG TPA: Gfo/Idh/MocA family oxidoreductase [Streptosporangiaceae bacterium]|nr:Gfo/Idh/MocA family oxidoreductase [Streptosporangiaceae bacterium]
MTAGPIRWGILGTGRIARIFAADLMLLPDHEVAAVGSRAPHTAEAFAAEFGPARAYGTYAELAADDTIDVVYVATPHSGHLAAARQCLEAGRAVLVEKPLAPTAAEAAELVDLARKRRLFLLEGMWTRFNPLIVKLRELVADGAIGEVTAVYADFCWAAPYDPASRFWSPDLAGGALLDLGVYPLSFTSMLLGRPDTVHARAAAAPTGVDANTGILLGYDSGALALLHCGLTAESPQRATVVGTKGRVELPPAFFRPTTMTLHRAGAEPETFELDLKGYGFTYEADEVARCLRAGLQESPHLPLEESLAISRTVDTIAAQLQP